MQSVSQTFSPALYSVRNVKAFFLGLSKIDRYKEGLSNMSLYIIMVFFTQEELDNVNSNEDEM